MTFWHQAALLALALALLHARGERRDTGRWPATWRQWREIVASIVVCVLLFGAVSGGRGCAGPPTYEDDNG